MEESPTPSASPAKLQNPDTILVIDDDDNWCYLATKTLQKTGIRSRILTATNGQEGLKTLQAITAEGGSPPELIFLDIKMPVMDGFDFLEELARSPGLDLSQTRIYMCSSSFHPKDREKANTFPIAGFLNKPLTQEILKEILAS